MDYATKADLGELRDELRGEIRAVGVMVEHVASQIRLLAEGQVSLREQFTAEIRAVREELGARISLLEEVIRQHSVEIQELRSDVRVLKDDVRALKDDVRVLKDDVRVLKDDVRVLKDDVRVLKDDVRVLKVDVADLKVDVADLRRRFDRYDDNTELTKRVEELEKRVGIVR